MGKIANPSVDINEMIDAFEDNYFIGSYINTMTGEVISLVEGERLSDLEDKEEEDEEEDGSEFIPDYFLSLPDKYEVNKFGMMEDFCHTIKNGKIQNNLFNSLGGKGSFGRFMTLLHAYEIQDEWYRYLHERLKEFSIQFCKDHLLKYHYTRPLRFQ